MMHTIEHSRLMSGLVALTLTGLLGLAPAATADGSNWSRHDAIAEAVGGCLMASDDLVQTFGDPRVAPPRSSSPGEPSEIRSLVTHPMETGLREGPDGEVLARRMLDTLTVEYQGDTVLTVNMHTAVSENPYMRFFMAPEVPGEAIFRWTEEDTGETVDARVDFDL